MKTKLEGMMANAVPGAVKGAMHEKMAKPNTANSEEVRKRIEKDEIDPRYIISHRITLERAPVLYKIWRDKKENITKIVIDPWAV